ncbi:AraC family transcriptional regulator [Paraburkholderia sp. MMS20-SJTR3]|uniref:AraC family transcriptional regulator n=1 Tax=Paraburkholderia sejongensis TaxID=2886946 RepID=A0ABS8K026_9BURK|nr:GyrI-like domain-containing protein [Paraburkholderia sp. MMS20-SJTR3]MCC8395229.1 AraC family transcriptional regulator [Paraburkholderia sp. MMS20-SJTR3]
MKPSTERDYRRRIARVVEAILVEPGAPHTLESLAALAHLSPYHFHRIYRAMMGESAVDTVKRLRLAQAAQRLTDAAQVTAVAHDAGYDSAQAFARAFRDFAGVSPSGFRARQRQLGAPAGTAAPLPARRRAALAALADGAAARHRSAAGGANDGTGGSAVPGVEVVELPPLEVLCMRHDGPVATIDQTFRALLTMLRCAALPLAPQRIGICARDTTRPGSLLYRAGIVATRDDANVPCPAADGPIQSLRIEGGLYAAHRLIGPYALISPTFRALYTGWLPRSGYRRDSRPALELYRSSPEPGAQPACVTDLLIPIRKD